MRYKVKAQCLPAEPKKHLKTIFVLVYSNYIGCFLLKICNKVIVNMVYWWFDVVLYMNSRQRPLVKALMQLYTESIKHAFIVKWLTKRTSYVINEAK
ncbi:hypothetical protein F929_02785 [Acinetobacter lactucae]|uniref:Uncharacterized protein n=1 Tax=Acinetobacter lactucae TaxID=1785128 RepID=R8YTU6_9GAMM|nr:hypothetical protein F929_02785 [Acinetobacter lactucae]